MQRNITGARLTVFLAATLWLLFGHGLAAAEQRLALVLGNNAYANLSADSQLRKAVNDANAVGDTLERIGFKVTRGINLNRTQMVDTLFQFAQTVKEGDTAVVYYAGHGVAINGANFLLPADIPDASAGEEQRIAHTAISELDIINDVQAAHPRLLLLVMDACRNNPFRRLGTRSLGTSRGLARLDIDTGGLFAIYSASVGQRALDGLGAEDPNPNSVFTRVFVQQLAKTDQTLNQIALATRSAVVKLAKAEANQDQRPGYYDEMGSDPPYLLPRDTPAAATTDAPTVSAAPAPKTETASLLPGPVPSPAALDEEIERKLYLSLNDKIGIEINLSKLGFKPGDLDGVFEQSTRIAIMGWQNQAGLKATGYLVQDQANKLIAGGAPGEAGQVLTALYQELPKNLEQKFRDAFKKLEGKPIAYVRVGQKLFVAVQFGDANTGVTYAQAKAKAADLGGSLAVITSAAENRAIFEMIKNDPRFWYTDKTWAAGPWIGYAQKPGTRSSRAGWIWAAGKASSFTNWSPGQPNETQFTTNDIAAAYGGESSSPIAKWQDMSVFKAAPGFIVEF